MSDFADVPRDDVESVATEVDEIIRSEHSSLEMDCRHRETLINLNKQREKHRAKAIGMAEGAISGIALFLVVMSGVLIFGAGSSIEKEAQVAIFTVPIVAISLIVVFVLRGVFSGFSSKEETNGLAYSEVADTARDLVS